MSIYLCTRLLANSLAMSKLEICNFSQGIMLNVTNVPCCYINKWIIAQKGFQTADDTDSSTTLMKCQVIKINQVIHVFNLNCIHKDKSSYSCF